MAKLVLRICALAAAWQGGAAAKAAASWQGGTAAQTAASWQGGAPAKAAGQAASSYSIDRLEPATLQHGLTLGGGGPAPAQLAVDLGAGLAPGGRPGLPQILHELELSKASAEIIAEENQRLRERLAGWHQYGARLAASEAQTLELLEDDDEDLGAEPLVDGGATPLPVQEAPLDSSPASSSRRRRRSAIAMPETATLAPAIPLQESSLKLVKVGQSKTLDVADVRMQGLLSRFKSRLLSQQPLVLFLPVTMLAMLAAFVLWTWRRDDGAERPAEGRWDACCLGCWRLCMGGLGELPAKVEIGELRLGGLSEELRSLNVRLIVRPGGNAQAMKTRYGDATHIEGEGDSMSFAEVMSIPAVLGDGPCEISVAHCDGSRTERIASVVLSPSDMLSMARRHSQYVTLELVQEGPRWQGREEPYLAMRIRELGQQMDRKRSARNLGRFQKSISGHLSWP